MYQQPPYRFESIEAITALAHELKLPYTSGMQDWAYEVADSNLIDNYLKHYSKQTDDDKKFVLMQMIIQAVNDLEDTARMGRYWDQIKALLIKDWTVHEYTAYYWSCFEEDELSNCFALTPHMRQLWRESTTTML
jgi:hypothetical protein